MTEPDDEQRDLNARLKAALQQNSIFARHDEQNRLFASDGKREYEVAIIPEETDTDYGAAKLIIGQRTLRSLESGNVGTLFFWGHRDIRLRHVRRPPVKIRRRRQRAAGNKRRPGMYRNPNGTGRRYWNGREWGPVTPGTSLGAWALRIISVVALAAIAVGGWALSRSHGDAPSSQTPTSESGPLATAPAPPATTRVDTPQTRYLRTLASEGIRVDDDAALNLGAMVCGGMAEGLDDDEIIPQLRRAAHIASQTAKVYLVTARFELCSHY